MEFFAEIKNNSIDKDSLKNILSIARLPELCHSIDTVIRDDKDSGVIYCVWGEFTIRREEICTGVRFSLPHCPNTIAWTITCDEHSNDIIIHLAMNKKNHDDEFIETIENFVSGWQIN